jgi:Txe/YoeB family toxin of Txe-Axe toxin-antitoxin module
MKQFDKRVEVHFADRKLKESFDALAEGRGEEKDVYEKISRAIDKLESDAFIGDRIPKNLIPKEYVKKYGVDNLRKINLDKSWRLIYTITSTEILIVSVILEWMPHKEYEKRFGYEVK